MHLFRHSEAIKELKNGSTMGQTRFWWSVSPRVAVAALKDSDSGNNTLNGSTMQEKKERKKKKKGRALCESIPSRIRRGTKGKKKNCNLFFLFFSWYCVRETFRLNRDPSLRNIKLPIFPHFSCYYWFGTVCSWGGKRESMTIGIDFAIPPQPAKATRPNNNQTILGGKKRPCSPRAIALQYATESLAVLLWCRRVGDDSRKGIAHYK